MKYDVLKIRFNSESQQAGWKLYYKFINNHADEPMNTGTNNYCCFQRIQLRNVGQFTADKFYNMDGT